MLTGAKLKCGGVNGGRRLGLERVGASRNPQSGSGIRTSGIRTDHSHSRRPQHKGRVTLDNGFSYRHSRRGYC